ncbi:MAG: T9SS C-terminal target domain-containing protein [Bacteroidetes bacterium]|nr:MAG: T9SS C-terminal target domain-containing protein [Bacteroidota bacterium]
MKADKDVDVVEWSVWPNPTDNEVYIKANNAEQFTYELYNTTGNLVIKSSILATEAKLDLSNTEHGIYYLKLTTTTGTSYHKVVKQ